MQQGTKTENLSNMELDENGMPIYGSRRDHHPAAYEHTITFDKNGDVINKSSIRNYEIFKKLGLTDEEIAENERLMRIEGKCIMLYGTKNLDEQIINKLKEKQKMSDFRKFKEQMLSDVDLTMAYITKCCDGLRKKSLRVEEVLPAMMDDFTSKDDFLFLKYHNGAAIYMIHAKSEAARCLKERDSITLPIMHLLSGKLFHAKCYDIKMITWDELHQSYQLDASALNPIVRNLFTENCKLSNNNNQKQNPMLKNMFSSLGSLGMDFGKIEGGKFAIAMTGQVAIKSPKNSGGFIVYDKPNRQLIEVGDLKMDVDFYKVPSQTVGDGDLILIDGNPLYVEKVNPDGSIVGINPTSGTRSTKIKRTNMFGFNFYTKVVSMLDMFKQNGNAGFNPMMALAMSEGNSGDMMGMMMMGQMMNNGANNGGMFGMFGGGQPTKVVIKKKAPTKKKVVAKKK